MKILTRSFVIICTLIVSFLPCNSGWQHYRHSNVPFEINYPTSLVATTSFVNQNKSYPVINIGTKDHVDLFVTIQPHAIPFQKVEKYGYGLSDIPVATTSISGYEAVILKELTGPSLDMLEKSSYEIFLTANSLDYYIIVDSLYDKEMIESIIIK